MFSKLFLVFLAFTPMVFAQQGNLVIGKKLKGVRVVEDVKLSDNELMVLSSNGVAINSWLLSPVTLVPKKESTPIAAGGSASKNNKKVVNASDMKKLDILSLDTKDIIFYSKYQKQDKTTHLYYETIDNSGKVMEMPKKLASNNNKAASGWSLLGLGSSGPSNFGFNITTNHAKNLVLITNQAADVKKGKNWVPAPVNLTLYDADMNEKGSTKLDMEVSNFGASAVLSNTGFVYNLVRVTLDKKEAKEKRKNGEAAWFYKIVGVNLNQPDAQPFEHDLIFKNRGILNASLAITDKGELICAGTYSELTTKGNIDDFDGIFYCKIDPSTGEMMSDNVKKLDRDLVAQMTSKKNSQRNEGLGTEFKIRGLVALEDGTSDLLLEEDYLIIVTTYRSNGGSTTTYHYYSKSILVANIAPSGDINWVKRIPKFQHTTNDGGAFNSFTYSRVKNELRLIFTDNKQNYDPKTGLLNQAKVKNLTSSKEGKTIILATVNSNGDVVQKKVGETQKHLIYARYGIWNKSGNEVYFQATPRISFGQCLLGCLFFPYGIYLQLKKWAPDMSLSRLELE